MASMSYCMFENTATELAQVANEMSEVDTWEDLDLSEYERHAKERLYDLCEMYLSHYRRLEEASQYGEEE